MGVKYSALRQKGLFAYFGGKNFMIEDVIHEIRRGIDLQKEVNGIDIKFFVDVFGGSGVLTTNIPSEWKITRIWNDLDKRLYTAMKVLQDPIKRNELASKLKWVLNSREEFESCKKKMNEQFDSLSDIEIAYCFIYTTFHSFSGDNKNYAIRKRPGNVEVISSYADKLEKIWEPLRRRFVIENLDFKKCIKKYDAPNTLFYLDPPYKLGQNYKHGFSDQDFKDLADILKNIKGIWLMNESERDFEYLEPMFGKPNMTKSYINFVQKTGAKRTSRLEGYWNNYPISSSVASI